MRYLEELDQLVEKGEFPPKIGVILRKFYLSYCAALVEDGQDISHVEPTLLNFLEMVKEQLQNPYQFEPFHKRITKPIDYYKFGLDFIRPLVVFEKSNVLGLNQANRMNEQIKQNENVILFANHQTEPDPQAISLLLEKTHPDIAHQMIFVAGHRVITDPLAVPFSKGCNLLCIYSKKYIETPPEQKREKLMHNKKTLNQMGELLDEGGKCIYVAPSGGRDRPNAEGVVEVAPFDSKSIEFFYLMGRQSKRPTHFYPLALETYALLPPPNSVDPELGEQRLPQCTPIHLAFGSEIEMENFPGYEHTDKNTRREERAKMIWNLVKEDYDKFSRNTR